MKTIKPNTLIVILTAAVMLMIPIVTLAADPPAPIEKTGQTTSYREGDDGDLQMGVASPNPRFTDNGDGTVTDHQTGLMWPKNANHGKMYWFQAIDYANNLSFGNDGCGVSYTDWRLPNIKELLSLTHYGDYNPALPVGHPFTSLTYNFDYNHYWSSTTNFQNSSHAWIVKIYNGSVYPNFKLSANVTYYVWPVRSVNLLADPPAPIEKTGQTTSYREGDDGDLQMGVASPNPRFTDNGDGTVTDYLTGLMWTKNANHGSKTWYDAIDYSNNLSFGNDSCGASYTDWRLPNIKEMLSLIDYGDYNPALPAGHPFTSVYYNAYHWSSTSYPTVARLVNFKGYVSDTTKSINDSTYVWPVRGGN
jgi:hypothetical protein